METLGATSGQGAVLERVVGPQTSKVPEAHVEQGGLASYFTGNSEMTWKENIFPRWSFCSMTRAHLQLLLYLAASMAEIAVPLSGVFSQLPLYLTVISNSS